MTQEVTQADCTCAEVFGEDPECALHGIETGWSLENREPHDWQQLCTDYRHRLSHTEGPGDVVQAFQQAAIRLRDWADNQIVQFDGMDMDIPPEIQAHCDKADAALSTNTQTSALREALEAAEARIERLRRVNADLEAGIVHPTWFYFGDDQSSENCSFSLDEAVDLGLDQMTRPEAIEKQPFEVSTATSLKSIWVTVHFFTEEEKDARQRDDEYELTEHPSLEAAQRHLATLPNTSTGEGG